MPTSPDAQARLKADEPGNEWWWKAIQPLFARCAQHDRGLKTDVELIATTKEFAQQIRDGLETESRTPDAQPSSESDEITDDQIKHMVDRFLSWRLPKNFNPDCGITAVRPNYGPNVKWEPSGTNLLDAMQAEAMVRHMIVGLSQPSSTEGEVARAIYEANPMSGCYGEQSLIVHQHLPWEAIPRWAREIAIKQARAAIAAQVTKP